MDDKNKITFIYDKINNEHINTKLIFDYVIKNNIKYSKNMNGIFINLNKLDDSNINEIYNIVNSIVFSSLNDHINNLDDSSNDNTIDNTIDNTSEHCCINNELNTDMNINLYKNAIDDNITDNNITTESNDNKSNPYYNIDNDIKNECVIIDDIDKEIIDLSKKLI
jgi:hypothetical protein